MPDTPFSELSKKEKLARARRARRKAHNLLEGPTRSNVRSVRAGAARAKKAAERVERRLTGRGPSRIDATMPSHTGLARGLSQLAELAKLPGKLKEGLEGVERASRGK